MKNGGIIATVASCGFMLALAGCQSNVDPAVAAQGDALRPPVKESELRAYCPNVSLREGTAYYNQYVKKGETAADKIVYQVALTDTTRACTYDGGNVTINVAVAGKVVPGPQGKVGTVKLPIRVAVVRGTDVLYTKLHDYTVNVGDLTTATQFTFNDPAITIPMPERRDVMIFTGFDEGPPKAR